MGIPAYDVETAAGSAVIFVRFAGVGVECHNLYTVPGYPKQNPYSSA
jgi:hypothetical protein